MSADTGFLKRGIKLSPRQWFAMLAVVLVVLLIGLLVYLLYFLGRPEPLTSREATKGIQPVWQVYGPGVGTKPLFDRPMGVAVGERGRVYVTDPGNNRVCVFDSGGKFLFEFGRFGVAKPLPGGKMSYVPGSLNYPVGIDTDEDGNVYVASFRNDSIEVFDADGTPLRRFPDPAKVVGRGSSGQDGGGIAVTDVAVHDGKVYALDQYQVFVFTTDGTFVAQWGKPGTAPGDLDHPNGIDVGEDGTVYVSDSNHARVTAFSPQGEALWNVGTIPKGISDTADRPLQLPRGLTVLKDGDILVTDAFAFCLVRVSSDGKVEGTYGERGVDPGQLNFPNDVETLRNYVVIADKENGRVQAVRLLD
ncbi:MAG: 6-bladed beta-propeller [Coriobacteriales bacterium]